MAFKTIVKQKYRRNKDGSIAKVPRISIRRVSHAYLSRLVRGDDAIKTLRFEIDENTKRFRLKMDPEGDVRVQKKGTFTIAANVVRTILPVDKHGLRFDLTLSDDGWYYASYNPKDIKNGEQA
jgi:hypothetical protein